MSRGRATALVVTVLLLIGVYSGGCEGGDDTSFCEQKWNENASTARSEYMTRERYIANCEQTNDDIRDGLFGEP